MAPTPCHALVEPERGCVVLDQPQHAASSRRLRTSHALRLVFDTAALRSKCAVDTPGSFASLAARFSWIFPRRMKTTNRRTQRRMRVRAPRLSVHYSRLPSMAKASRSSKYVYLFGNKKADGDGSRKA